MRSANSLHNSTNRIKDTGCHGSALCITHVFANTERNYLLWTLGTNTGLRISDILKLRVKDVKGSFINIVEQKTQKKRTIKINKKLKDVIKDFIKGMKDNDVLFQSRVGVNRALGVRRCQQIIKEVASLVGIEENINTHTMRKTFALNLYRVTGNNIGLVMEALNHSKEIITLRYLCLIDEMLDNSIDLLADI